MGRAIPVELERRIKLLLLKRWTLMDISIATGCSRMTIRAIRDGRTVQRQGTGLRRRYVKPYVCAGCSKRAGRDVKTCYRPCVACDAVNAREARINQWRD